MDAERFWSKVNLGDPDHCWEWTGAIISNRGYGKLKVKGKHRLAHRLAWELKVGEIPSGKCVCHKCDNPACVNPSHLFLASHAENMADMVRKGRSRSHGRPRLLDDSDKAAIRSDTRIQKQIASDYGISQQAVSAIKLGRW